MDAQTLIPIILLFTLQSMRKVEMRIQQLWGHWRTTPALCCCSHLGEQWHSFEEFGRTTQRQRKMLHQRLVGPFLGNLQNLHYFGLASLPLYFMGDLRCPGSGDWKV